MAHLRRRRTLYVPLTLSAALMGLNVALMVCWIVLLAQHSRWSALTIGTVAFALILLGLSFYVFLTVKERQLNQRQSNFVDSVTHELKSPVASLQLYLETLQLRDLDADQRAEFYRTMGGELHRLDDLITQLLEVARLDAVGHSGEQRTDLQPVLESSAKAVCARHGCGCETFTFDLQPDGIQITTSRLVLEMIVGNLLDNAVKYGGDPPRVDVEARAAGRGRVVIRVADNGPGVPPPIRKRIFRLFFRGGDELQRRQTGTGLGLYIARTLVAKLRGKLSVADRDEQEGSVFELELPGEAPACGS